MRTSRYGWGHPAVTFSARAPGDSLAGGCRVGTAGRDLKGANVAKEFKKGGDWTIKGKISADGKSIEVTEMKKKA